MIKYYEQQMKHCDDCLNINNNVNPDNVMEWVKKYTEQYVADYMFAVGGAVEHLLHTDKCYHGFVYIDTDGNMLGRDNYEKISDNPKFREWRRQYITS